MSEQTLAIINKYPVEQYNVLAPATVTEVTPWHQVTVSQVQLSPDPRNGGDVYPQSGKLALTKIALLKLADAAGIRFKSRTQLKRHKDGSFEAYCIAEKQDPDGTWRQYPGSYYWDTPQRVSDVRDPDSRKGQAELRMIKTFGAQRAETGAMNRAIRAIIGIKSTYTPAEIQRPFVVARVSFNPFNDPAIRDAYREALVVRLAENVALMRGDFNAEDPLGIEGPHQSTRPSAEQLSASDDTLQLLTGSPEWEDAPEEWFDGDESPEPVKPAPEPDDIMVEAPKSNGRPLTAEQVRDAIHTKAGWVDGQRLVGGEPITAKQVGFLAGLIGNATKRDGMTQAMLDKARYDILSYLTGDRSTKKLTKKEASAMIDWLGGDEVGDINEWARSEAAAIIEAVGVGQGQEELPY